MKLRLRIRELPLFLRIFALMLLTLLLVQALNFVVVLLSPLPQPTVTNVDHLVAVLRTEEAPGRNLALKMAPLPQTNEPQGGGERELRKVLAGRLSVPETAVHVRFMARPPFGDFLRPRSMRFQPGGMPARPGPVPLLGSDGRLVLMGDFAVSARLNGQWRTVQLTGSQSYLWRMRSFIWLLVAMVVVAPLAWLAARSLARPIRLFADAAHRLGRDPKAPPLEVRGPPEIREAASAFNEMQGRLNRYVEDRTTLMAAIAHDMRTPLMRLGLRLENAPDKLREACEEDIRDMDAMVNAVMSFVRDMSQPSRRLKVDLRTLAESVTHDFVDADAMVLLFEGPPLVLEGDPSALKTVLQNLVGNAVKYANGAEVSLYQDGDVAVIEVADRGPGLSDDDLHRAFDPFFRAERSRNRDTGGIGLGLASVRAVARAHGGEAMLTNRTGGGLVASVRLPI